jgi:hypothetical protein
MGELTRRLTYQGLETIHGLGHETVRKFVEYDPERGFGTRMPRPRQREKYGELFLEMHPEGYVMERKADGSPGALPPLKTVLPSGEERAEAALEAIFARAAAHPDGLPQGVTGLEGWLKKLVRAQYAADRKYSKPKP